MDVKQFDFELPQELIAQTPIPNRDASRLLIMNRENGEIRHRHFFDLVEELHAGDCLVLNNTKVIPARLYGVMEGSGGAVEFLLLRRIDDTHWETMVRPGRKLREGKRVVFGDGQLAAEVEQVLDNGNRVVRFEFEGVFEQILDSLGEMPLPHYITHKLEDRERYQTVYAKYDGSAAAPTAGLHFTPELLQKLQEKGVELAYVTLHVGIGTFRPVKVDKVEDHEMHSEMYEVTQECADTINHCRAQGGRIIAVGTTSCRTLETIANDDGTVTAGSGATNIFIYPGYQMKVVDCLITNFHLPQSTLIMLVSTIGGYEHTMHAYAEAIAQRYRFYSFGDAMFIC